MTVNKLTDNVQPMNVTDKINEIIDEFDNLNVDIDGSTITKNSSDELQTVAVKDNRSGNAIKTWTGTKAQYDAIVTKDANTLYICTDSGEIFFGLSVVANKAGNDDIGTLKWSLLPLTDAGLHLLDGGLVHGGGIYDAFVDYIADLHVPNTVSKFVQPVLSADGGLGGNSFAVSTNVPMIVNTWGAYLAFRGFAQSQPTDPIFHSTANNVTGYIDMYNPLPLNITSIKIYNQLVDNRASSAGNIYASNDGTSWTLLTTYSNSNQSSGGIWTIDLSSNSSYYKYYRMESTIGGSGGYWSIAEVELTATYLDYPKYFCTEAEWQNIATTYGACGKFVYDSINNTVRLPKVTGIIEGTTDLTALGDLVEAGLPYHTHKLYTFGEYGEGHGGLDNFITSDRPSTQGYMNTQNFAGEFLNNANGIYGKSNTVQPQTIKTLYYIVIATSTKTDIEVDIDEVVTDLNGKADVDLSNINASQSAKNEIISWGLPDYSNGIGMSIPSNSFSYNCPNDGIISIKLWGTANVQLKVYVNGSTALMTCSGSSTTPSFLSGCVPVSKNDVITISGGASFDDSVHYMYFYPMKGAN